MLGHDNADDETRDVSYESTSSIARIFQPSPLSHTPEYATEVTAENQATSRMRILLTTYSYKVCVLLQIINPTPGHVTLSLRDNPNVRMKMSENKVIR